MSPVRNLSAGRAIPVSWRILVVENDEGRRESLACDLRRCGHRVAGAATGVDALQGCEEADLVLLDLELPDLDGLEVCRSIRATCDVPVIVVTSWGTELDRVLGLQAGADDYVVTPYSFRELGARIDAVMRRVQKQLPVEQVIQHGCLRIDARSREVFVGEQRVSVTRKEFDLLHLLASQPEAVVPRKRIMQKIWGDSWSRRTVDTHVSSLRGKLGKSDWIITVRGVGFRIGNP